MGRNVTSLEYVPRGLSKPSQALALTPSGLRLLCVQLHLEAWTTAVPVLGGARSPPLAGARPSCGPSVRCRKTSLPQGLHVEHLDSEEKTSKHALKITLVHSHVD